MTASFTQRVAEAAAPRPEDFAGWGEAAVAGLHEDEPTGADVLDELAATLSRFVVFPGAEHRDAVALWVAHAHVVEAFESSPRLALLSPEPASGKTRTLEVIELLVPRPMHALNASTAAVFRSIDSDRPTLLLDEVDAIFGRRTGDENEDLRALLNAGHRRGTTIPRCVGKSMEVKRFPVYAALALAGLGDLPDTLMSRSVIVRMRRRAPAEDVEPFRYRLAEPDLHDLRDRLGGWLEDVRDKLADHWPTLPAGITDRPADCWEPLLSVADLAGGDWPERARAACVELCKVAESREASLGVRLLSDLRTVFGPDVRLRTDVVLDRLHKLEEAPWDDLRGKPLDARGLAYRLRQYEVRPHQFKVGEAKVRGYSLAGTEEDGGGLYDAFNRYLPRPHGTDGTSGTEQVRAPDPVPDSRWGTGTAASSGTADDPLTSGVPEVPDVPLPGGKGTAGQAWTPARQSVGRCYLCAEPTVTADENGRPCHIACGVP